MTKRLPIKTHDDSLDDLTSSHHQALSPLINPEHSSVVLLESLYNKKDYKFDLIKRLVKDRKEFQDNIDEEERQRKAADIILQQNIDAEEVARIAADNDLSNRIRDLGVYVGAWNTYADLPKVTTGFSRIVDINDFATIRNDTADGRASRYVITAISGTNITWTFDLTYSQDIIGKANRVVPCTAGNFANLTSNGDLSDSGRKASDFDDADSTLQTNINGKQNMLTGTGFVKATGSGNVVYDAIGPQGYQGPQGSTGAQGA